LGVYYEQYDDPYPYGSSTNTTGSHLTGGSGVLSLIATPSSYFSGFGYSWASAGVSSFGHIYLPATGGYVQWQAKMPDSRYGAIAGLWLLPQNASATYAAEMDVQLSGFLDGSVPVNQVMTSSWHGPCGSTKNYNTGVDLTAAYHSYGVEFVPGVSWTVYLDGIQMYQVTGSSCVPAAGATAFEILMDLEIGNSGGSGFQTVGAATTEPYTFSVEGLQIYGLP
jgi:hypothetical protein